MPQSELCIHWRKGPRTGRLPIRVAGLLLMIGLMVSPNPAAAQARISNVGTVTLNATMSESLSVSVTSGNIVDFNLLPNTAANPGNVPSVITTAWVLRPGRTSVTVWAWVPVRGAALTGAGAGGQRIPARAVSITTTAGANAPVVASGALNATRGGTPGAPGFISAGGSGLNFATKAITAANRNSIISASLAWNINTTVRPQLAANTYTGVVNIQAQATP